MHGDVHMLCLPVLAGLFFYACVVPVSETVQYVSETPKTFAASLPSDPRLVVGFVLDRSKLPGPRKDLASRPQYAMTASDGERFTCYTFNETATPSQELQPLQGQMFPPFPQKSPFELLDALTGLCLYRQQGLWTYSWCHKSEVYQLRQEKASKPKERFSLGSWPGEDAQVEDIKVDHTISSVPVKYVSHNFTGGDTCLLNGEPRTAEVRFTCMKDVKDSIIFSVNEFPTCNYVFVVATPFLCKHPEFKPQPEVVSSIVCVPQKSGDEDHHDIMAASGLDTPEDEGTDAASSNIPATADEHAASSIGMEEVGGAPGADASGHGREGLDAGEGSTSASNWQDIQERSNGEAHAQEAVGILGEGNDGRVDALNEGKHGVGDEDGRDEVTHFGGHGDAIEAGSEDSMGQAVGDTSVGDHVRDRSEGIEGSDSGQGLSGEEHVGEELSSEEPGVEEVEWEDSSNHHIGGVASEGEVEAGQEESAMGEPTNVAEGDHDFWNAPGQQDGSGEASKEDDSGVEQGSGYDGSKWVWLEGQWHWLPDEGASTGDYDVGEDGLSGGEEGDWHSQEGASTGDDAGEDGTSVGEEGGGHSEEEAMEHSARTEL